MLTARRRCGGGSVGTADEREMKMDELKRM